MSISGEHVGNKYLNQSQVGNHSLDLFDDFWLGSSVEGFELHVKDRLFFWFFLETVSIVSIARPLANEHKEKLNVPPQQALQGR